MNYVIDFMNQLDLWVLALSVPLMLCYFVFGVDDFAIDLLAWTRKCRPTELNRRVLGQMLRADQKRIAILVASWKESGVLHKMVNGNSRAIEYDHYDFVLGVYPNDPETLAEAKDLARRLPNVRVVVNSRPGPTSKGQMLNEMVRAAMEVGGKLKPYDAFLIHDSEDLIHRWSLPMINANLDQFDFIQVPIFSLPLGKSEFVAGTYVDEFSEYHTKDIILRNKLGVSIPSAGVGTAVSRRLVLKYWAEQEGCLLDERSLTEDYELGVSTSRYGMRSTFLCHFVREKEGKVDFIATREYFPKSFTRSILQKTRWTVGIAFQGWEHLGWKGGLLHRYFLYRDRKGPLANLLVALGGFFFIYCAFRSMQNPELFSEVGDSSLLYFGFAITAFFMINRVLQRMYCVAGVYGIGMALTGLIRLPIANLINAIAAFRAINQYARSKVFGTAVQWQKTEHELPVGFGHEVQEAPQIAPQITPKIANQEALEELPPSQSA